MYILYIKNNAESNINIYIYMERLLTLIKIYKDLCIKKYIY